MNENINRIKESIETIEPLEGAKERMLKNIMEKSRTISNPMNNVFDLNKIIKWALPLVACLVLAVVAVTVLPGLKKPTGPDGPGGSGETQITSPYQDVDGAADFVKLLGITLDAPASGTEKAYHIVDFKIADIDFDLGGHTYSLRAAKTTEDFSGVEGEVVKTEPISLVDGAHLDTIMCFEEQYLRISWTVNDTTYCLSNFDGATAAELTTALEGVSCGR